MKTIGVGVVGIGFGQQVHVPAFRADPRCEVVGICATSVDRASTVAARLGIERAFTHWEDLLDDPRVDAVAISTPPGPQALIALEALRRGKHVFCEKPLALSLEAAAAMSAAARAAGAANMIDFWFPELGTWKAAKRLIDDGAVGSVRHVLISWEVETRASRLGLQSWKIQERDGGGVLYAFAPHVLYNLEWLLGPIDRVWASSFREMRPDWSGDTTLMLCLVLQQGAPVSVTLSSSAPLGSGHRLEVYGEAGALTLVNASADYASGFVLAHGTQSSGSLREMPVDFAPPESSDGRVSAVAMLVHRFLDWIIDGIPTTPGLAEGQRVQQLLEAVQGAQRISSWVDVRENALIREWA